METLSYTAVRANFAKAMEHVCRDHVPVLVTRAKSKPVVIISLEDYAAMEETFYLLKSPENAARLSASIDEIEAMIAAKKGK
jgi:antitoxin YefM